MKRLKRAALWVVLCMCVGVQLGAVACSPNEPCEDTSGSQEEGIGDGLGSTPEFDSECEAPVRTEADARVLQEVLKEQEENDFQGFAYVLQDDSAILQEGVGGIDGPGSPTPTLDTAFDCGSVTKEVTALALYILEEEGLVKRSQPISSYLNVPAKWEDVTIQQILLHRGGFESVHDESDFENLTRAQALERIFNEEPRFVPGTERYYSNSGYTVLGAILEVVSARPYQEIIRTKVWEPLEMTSTGFYGEETDAQSYAIGEGILTYGGRNDPSAWPAPQWAILGNAGMVSTPRDLVKHARALHEGVLFSEATQDAWDRDFLEANFGTTGEPLEYDYGGSTEYGYNAAIRYVPEDDILVIVNAHTSPQFRAEECADALLESVYNP